MACAEVRQEEEGAGCLSSSLHTLLSTPPSVAQAPAWGPSRQPASPRCYWHLQQRVRQDPLFNVGGGVSLAAAIFDRLK